MLDRLHRLIDELWALNSKLALVTGPPGSGKSRLLYQAATLRHARVVRVGSELGHRLLSIPRTHRPIGAPEMFREVLDECETDGLVLLDNLELLFDATLKLNPLDILRRQAHARVVVAAWPGESAGARLTYAQLGHSEHRDYTADGVVTLKLG
jgi:energy-coupling factor transporter ATP-binding protein EcfA2